MKWFGPRPAEHFPSDEHAMLAVQRNGDPGAFSTLVTRWESAICRMCTRMVSDVHRAEDLTQETFARVFANRAQFDASRRFSTWMWQIALNLCREDLRRRKSRGEMEFETMPLGQDTADDPAAHASRAEHAELVRRAMAHLSDENRAVVVLREYEQLKFREIAEVLNVPEGTVKWRMREALAQLAADLKPLINDASPQRSTSKTEARLAI